MIAGVATGPLTRTGGLRRNGVRWPMYWAGTRHIAQPIDDLYVGDVLQLPERVENVLLRVVGSHRRMFAPDSHRHWRRFVVAAQADCPACGRHGAHDVRITALDNPWPFERLCACGHAWLHPARHSTLPEEQEVLLP